MIEIKMDEESRERLAREIQQKVLSKVSEELDSFQGKIAMMVKTNQEVMANFLEHMIRITNNKDSPLINLYTIFEKIRVEKKIDAEVWVKKYFEEKGYEVRRDHPTVRSLKYVGKPDFVICPFMFDLNGEKIFSDSSFFVEVKTNGDGLKREQMRWIKDNPNYKVIVFYLEQEVIGFAKDKLNAKEKSE